MLSSTQSFNKTNITSFPNPFDDNFSINLSSIKLENASLQIYNTLGQLIYKNNFSNNNGKNIITIYSDNWRAGIYIVEIKSNFTTYKTKIIKA